MSGLKLRPMAEMTRGERAAIERIVLRKVTVPPGCICDWAADCSGTGVLICVAVGCRCHCGCLLDCQGCGDCRGLAA